MDRDALTVGASSSPRKNIMDLKALLLLALKNPALRGFLTPLLQGMAVVALEELARRVKSDPTIIANLVDQLAKLVDPT